MSGDYLHEIRKAAKIHPYFNEIDGERELIPIAGVQKGVLS